MCRQFNVGGSNQLSFLTASLIGSGTYPFTVSLWAWPWVPSGATPQILFAFQDAGFSNAIDAFLQSNQVGMNYVIGGSAGTPVYVPVTIPNFTRWTNVTLVATSATNRRLYVGFYGCTGVWHVDSTVSATLGSLAGSAFAAGSVGGTPVDTYEGLLDEIAIWNVALSMGEVKQIAERKKIALNVRSQSLKHFFRLGYAARGDYDLRTGTQLTTNGFYDPGYVPKPFVANLAATQAARMRGFRAAAAPPRRPVVQACG